MWEFSGGNTTSSGEVVRDIFNRSSSLKVTQPSKKFSVSEIR
jgi:hypothetical protein